MLVKLPNYQAASKLASFATGRSELVYRRFFTINFDYKKLFASLSSKFYFALGWNFNFSDALITILKNYIVRSTPFCSGVLKRSYYSIRFQFGLSNFGHFQNLFETSD